MNDNFNSPKSLEEKKIIHHLHFTFHAVLAEKNIKIICIPDQKKYIPLCKVVETSWLYSPKKLLKSVLSQHGQSFEGDVSFAYYEDYPDELEPGVTLEYFNDELLISTEVFSDFVLELVQFYLKAAKLFELSSVSDEAELHSFVEKSK